ncbi:hypothetical protein JHK86_003991 [Glycine max]|nr:hypothetical protein JHK86_003991 [Glycine max]
MENKNNKSNDLKSEPWVVVIIFLLKIDRSSSVVAAMPSAMPPSPFKAAVTLNSLKEQVPQNLEPTKCDDWDWYEWDHLSHPLFGPLEKMVKGAFDPFLI